MTTTLLFHLATTAIVLAVLYPLVAFLLWISRPSSARLYRFAWSGVLVIPFFALSLPVAIPVAGEDEQSRNLQIAQERPARAEERNPLGLHLRRE